VTAPEPVVQAGAAAAGEPARRAGPWFGIWMLGMGASELLRVTGLIGRPRSDEHAFFLGLNWVVAVGWVVGGLLFLRFRPIAAESGESTPRDFLIGLIIVVWGLLLFGIVTIHDRYGGAVTVGTTIIGAVVMGVATLVLARWAGRRARA
jgi:hypothetical protein